MFNILRIFLLVLACAVSQSAWAAHFRHADIAWRVPNPQAAPYTVEFTVTATWAGTSGYSPVLSFGDGTTHTWATVNRVGGGIDPSGNAFSTTRNTVTHVFPGPGAYEAFYQSSARIAGLSNVGQAAYYIGSKVNLGSGNTAGPRSAVAGMVQLQNGGLRELVLPMSDSDGDAVTCRLAAPGDYPTTTYYVPPPSIGGKSPSLRTEGSACVLSWDLSGGSTTLLHSLPILMESTRGGVTSTTVLDLIVSTNDNAPPTCLVDGSSPASSTGSYDLAIGTTFSASMTATNPIAGNLTVQTFDQPAGSTVSPTSGSSGASPMGVDFSWTPLASDSGATRVVLFNFTNSVNASGMCSLSLFVEPVCGNGAVETGEECDDGNTSDDDTCTNECVVPEPPVLTVSGSSSYFVVGRGAVRVAPDLSLTDADGGTVDGARVTLGTVASGDVLSYDGFLASQLGIAAIYDAGVGVLTFAGDATAADYQALLRSVTFDSSLEQTSSADRVVTFNVGGSSLYSPDTGHFYEYVPGATTWTSARDLAADRSYYGLQGYLTTITSAEENAFVHDKIGSDSWLGGSDAAAEGAWRWVTGPEAGTPFSYTRWALGEPNNSGDEDYAEFYAGTGSWNDLAGTTTAGCCATIVEYGGMPGDPVLQLAGTTTVTVNHAPTAIPQSVSTAEETAKAITLSGTDVDGDTLNYGVWDGPWHGTLSGTPPNLVYTPADDYTGPDSFTFLVADARVTVSATVTFEVTAVNDAPTATGQAVTTAEDTAKTITLAGADVDGDALTFVVLSGPTRGTLSGTGATRTYTPTGETHGADAFTFEVRDGTVASAPATVSIEVTPVDDAPTATAQAVTTEEDTAKAITLAGADADGDPLTFTVVSGPSNGTLSGTAPNLTYTPTDETHGADAFTFVANDGALTSAPATVSVEVTPVNDAPTATAQAVTTEEDTAKPITLAGADIDGDDLTFAVVSGPAHGTLSGTAPDLVYTPSGDHVGQDTFTFQANDGTALSPVATVTLQITAVNDAPVAAPDSVVVAEGGTVTELADGPTSVLANDGDVEGTALTAALVTDVSHGTLTLNPDGTFVYTHDGSETVADAFTYVVSDGELDSVEATVTLEVTPVDDAPVIGGVEDRRLADPDSATIAVTVGDVDDDASSLVLTVDSSALDVIPLGRLVLGGTDEVRTLTVTSAGLVGSSTVTLTVSDPAGLQATTSFVVHVTCADDLDGDAICDGTDEDTDGDGMADVDEGTGDHDGDGVSDYMDDDSDNDGLVDAEEVAHGTDPYESDTDADGLGDGIEVDEHGTDPLEGDTDADGLTDGDEVAKHGTDPIGADTDADGLTDGEEVLDVDSDPLEEDTDLDGLLDGEEVFDFGTDPVFEDTDGDGLVDGEEVDELGTDPLDEDTDGDGHVDGDEVDVGTDPLTGLGSGGPVGDSEYVGGGCSTLGGTGGMAPLFLVALAGLLLRPRQARVTLGGAR